MSKNSNSFSDISRVHNGVDHGLFVHMFGKRDATAYIAELFELLCVHKKCTVVE